MQSSVQKEIKDSKDIIINISSELIINAGKRLIRLHNSRWPSYIVDNTDE